MARLLVTCTLTTAAASLSPRASTCTGGEGIHRKFLECCDRSMTIRIGLMHYRTGLMVHQLSISVLKTTCMCAWDCCLSLGITLMMATAFLSPRASTCTGGQGMMTTCMCAVNCCVGLVMALMAAAWHSQRADTCTKGRFHLHALFM
jgi:hypothetical protein